MRNLGVRLKREGVGGGGGGGGGRGGRGAGAKDFGGQGVRAVRG